MRPAPFFSIRLSDLTACACLFVVYQVLLADPVGSVFTNYFRTGELGEGKKFLVEGVGKNNIPGCLDMSVVDDVLPVTDCDAFKMCYKLAKTEGIFVGGSAGLNVHAAVELAKTVEGPATIVTLLCDLGVKYLSKVYNCDWLEENELDLEQDTPSTEDVKSEKSSSPDSSPRAR